MQVLYYAIVMCHSIISTGRDAGSEDACNVSLVETLLYPFPKVVWCSALNQCVLLCANARWTW